MSLRKSILKFFCFVLLLSGCQRAEIPIEPEDKTVEPEPVTPEVQPVVEEPDFHISVDAIEEGQIVFYSSSDYYRYGPSIMKYEDGSMDAWFSSPGNNSTEWDWITYRHSEDGLEWSSEEVVLRPTRGSKDSCSVCDPGVIYFDGYYYLAYTSTDYAAGRGSCNSAFVARSEYPDGPFEKWNGEWWGGDPEPIILYDGDPKGWGIGEVSFVIREPDLYIYYTYSDLTGGYTMLMKADLVENWPATMRSKGVVHTRENNDSLDVAYVEDLDIFLAFSIDNRMAEVSKLIVYRSDNGKSAFEDEDSSKNFIEDYAHNMGIAKSPDGHIRSDEPLLIGYAFGERWGRWSTRFQYAAITKY